MKINLKARQIAGIIMLAIGLVAISCIVRFSPAPFFPKFEEGKIIYAILTYVTVIVGLFHSVMMIINNKSIRLGWVPMAVFVVAIVNTMLASPTTSSQELPENVFLASLFIILILPIADLVDHLSEP